jgi:kynurenine formamidase
LSGEPCEIVDLTETLRPEMPVFPGDPAVTLTHVATHGVDGYEVTRMCLGSHSGTHLDAPRHFFPDGPALSDFPAERFVTYGVVLDVRGCWARPGQSPERVITKRYLSGALGGEPAGPGESVIFWTGYAVTSGDGAGESTNSASASITLSAEAARLLVEMRVGMVGCDAPGLDAHDAPSTVGRDSYPIHRILLGAGILLVENLCRLERLGSGRVQCAFLPLAVEGTDGAPVRAVAWKLRPSS